jgi:hypothetical protein
LLLGEFRASVAMRVRAECQDRPRSADVGRSAEWTRSLARGVAVGPPGPEWPHVVEQGSLLARALQAWGAQRQALEQASAAGPGWRQRERGQALEPGQRALEPEQQREQVLAPMRELRVLASVRELLRVLASVRELLRVPASVRELLRVPASVWELLRCPASVRMPRAWARERVPEQVSAQRQ